MKQEEVYNYCHVVGCTDVGRKRQANEDSMGSFTTPNGLVSVVCDGMGGHVGGATASRIAVEAIRSYLTDKYVDDPRQAIGEAIDAANRAILHEAELKPELHGMGSTCVLLLVRDAKVYIGSVGDSRVYLVRDRIIRQLTKDQSYVQMLVDAGQLTPEQAEHHPRKNEILNALGIKDMHPATVLPHTFQPQAGDCFLLCSDGLSGMVSDKEIARIVSRQAEQTSQERANALVALANEHGGLDNITVQLVEFAITPGQQTSPGPRKKKLGILIGIMAACVVLAGACIFFIVRPMHRPAGQGQKEAGGKLDSTVTMNPIPFAQRKEAVVLTYGDATTVASAADTLLIRHALTANTLKYDPQEMEMKYNGSMLCFKEAFKGEAVEFSLEDSAKVYHFRIPVIQKGKKAAAPAGTLIEQQAREEAQARANNVEGRLVKKDSLYTATFTFQFKEGDILQVRQVREDLQLKLREEVIVLKGVSFKSSEEGADLDEKNQRKLTAAEVKAGKEIILPLTGRETETGKTRGSRKKAANVFIKVVLHNRK